MSRILQRLHDNRIIRAKNTEVLDAEESLRAFERFIKPLKPETALWLLQHALPPSVLRAPTNRDVYEKEQGAAWWARYERSIDAQMRAVLSDLVPQDQGESTEEYAKRLTDIQSHLMRRVGSAFDSSLSRAFDENPTP